MFLVPLGVVFGGYQLVWYGFSLLKGPGMGFLDLLLPSRIAHAQEVVDGWGGSSSGNGPGDQPVQLVPVPPGPGSGTRISTSTRTGPNPGRRPTTGQY